MSKKLYPCMICEKRYKEIEEAEVCERRHDALAPHGTLRALKARTCAFCDHDPCQCATSRPKVLAPEALLRLGALTIEAESSDALEKLLDQQKAAYEAAFLERGVGALITALRDRDRLLANQGRQIVDGRAAGRLLREFMRAALYQAEGRPQIEAAEQAIRRLGGEQADARQLKLHGSTLGPLEKPEVVAEGLADGTRKAR
jgi:hypothetical protein